MRSTLSPRPSPAFVIALVALFAALGGSGYAALKINGEQIKDRSIPGSKLKRDALTSKEIKESGLTTVKRAQQAKSAAQAADALRAGQAQRATIADRAGAAQRAAVADRAAHADAAGQATRAATAGSADALSGLPESAFQRQVMWAIVNAAGSAVLAQSGGISVSSHFPDSGRYFLRFPAPVNAKALLVTPLSGTAGSSPGPSQGEAAACGGAAGGGPGATTCGLVNESTDQAVVQMFNAGVAKDVPFHVAVLP